MSREIDQLLENAWVEQYARMEKQNIVLLDLAVTCSRMRGYRWYAMVTRGVGASGHGKALSPTGAVDAAVLDYEKSRRVFMPHTPQQGGIEFTVADRGKE